MSVRACGEELLTTLEKRWMLTSMISSWSWRLSLPITTIPPAPRLPFQLHASLSLITSKPDSFLRKSWKESKCPFYSCFEHSWVLSHLEWARSGTAVRVSMRTGGYPDAGWIGKYKQRDRRRETSNQLQASILPRLAINDIPLPALLQAYGLNGN